VSTTILSGDSRFGATQASQPPAASSSGATGGGAGSRPTETPPATVAGSVLGAVGGLAVLLVAALFLLRWKKRRGASANLVGQGSQPGSRGLLTAGTGAPQNPGEMAEQRGGTFVVPGALASLTGNKRGSRQGTASSDGERGFHKVAGRKLPSVLQHGGDGFSAPAFARGSAMSDETIYRDSVAIFGGTPITSKHAVGSPMRPESGIPVYHNGPARTPVTEQGYFRSATPPGARSDSPTLLPPPSKDPLGRSHPSQDGSNRSHGSGSRFSEHL
jgi:hypothetical protein